ncbi:hypothetical protein NG799_22005 [Laspinema sp. D1]|uniref:Uncharacterized protein n=1 Tax=Laspinema palackyanum D2a TaxID=2953684 RepID=A0ABT2MW57_9CYAN|nr:hypothetical protein [Laspinema sp. D2a]
MTVIWLVTLRSPWEISVTSDSYRVGLVAIAAEISVSPESYLVDDVAIASRNNCQS